MDERKFLFAYDRRRTSTLTLDEQPGAHTGATRQYIPGYGSNIVYLNTATGNDGNTGASIAQAVQTYSQAATLAGTTKKIRLVNSTTLSTNITKPTEATIGTSSAISSSLTAPVNTWTQAGTVNSYQGNRHGIAWVPWLSKFICAGGTSKLYSTTDGDTFTAIAGHGFGSSVPECVSISQSRRLIFIAGTDGKIGYSSDGVTFTVNDIPEITQTVYGIHYDDASDLLVVVGANGMIGTSSDRGITFSVQFLNLTPVFYGVTKSDDLWVVTTTADDVYTSSNGYQYTLTDTTATEAWVTVFYSRVLSKFLLGGESGFIYSSANGTSWVAAATPSFGGDVVYGFAESIELGMVVAVGGGGKIAYSSDGDTFTQAATPSYGGSDVYAAGYSPLLGKFITGGASNKAARSTAFANTISAHVAGFSIQAILYSGTLTAYNCTLRQPGITAALTLDGCRVNYDSHISNNAAKSRATLYRGNRHTTCTPAAQNDIDMNLDTVGGTWYIYNASQTGYERIRDCIVEGGIVASYPVTVSGRANTRGTSKNVLFGATVTHNDPKFVDETDYALQYQTNGYDKNSPMAGRSAIYFNSSGGARDIGAWSYIESAVSYYYAKSRYLYKGEISHGLEFNLTEQQGDSGVMNVYGNTQRIKEVLTMQYGSTKEEERAVFYEMLTLKDKGVKITFAEWEDNTGTVTVNGNQSAGAEFLTVDAVQVFNGMTVTIAGTVYSVMRASPNMTAATKLIFDRATTDAVSDNDVLTTNYPSGAGEYQFSGPTNITMKQNAATGLTGWRTGFAIRLIRKYQG